MTSSNTLKCVVSDYGKRKLLVEVSWTEIHHIIVEIDVKAEYDEDLEEYSFDEDEAIQWAEEVALLHTPKSQSLRHTIVHEKEIKGFKEEVRHASQQ